MDLGFIGRHASGDSETFDRPIQVLPPLGLAQGQAFAQRRFVDLDHADAGGFEIAHLIAQCQRDLAAGLRAWLVVADEGPLQHRHRAGQHALHRPGGEGLRVPRPAHRHGGRPPHVAIDDRRLHAARAVALHPAVAGEGEAVEAFTEVLDHVVALEFAMDQHVDADRFLQAHAAFDLGSKECVVLRIRQLA